MKAISRLWRVYLFVAMSSIIALVLVGGVQWSKVKQKADTELRYLNAVSFNATRAMLNYQKSIFDMLSKEIREGSLSDDKNVEGFRELIDRVVDNNPDIAAFIVRNTEGQLLLADTKSQGISELSSMLEDPVTQHNLEKAIVQDKLAIGSNRFFPLIDAQVIGINYAVRKNGKVIAILTSAIKHNIDRSAWNNSSLTEGTILQVFKDDYHFIYSSRPQFRRGSEEYLKPISYEIVDYFIKQMDQQAGVSLEQLRTERTLVSVNALFAPGMDALFTIQYEPEYRYYTLASVERSSLYAAFMPTFMWQILMVLAFNLALYVIFRLFNKEQRISDTRLVFQANHDQLTGLPNRHYLAGYYDDWIHSCNGKFSILFIDLDNFKIINDNYGHSTGDKILVEVARRIEHQFKHLNIRHGGDEFVIFLPENDGAKLLKQAKRFISDLMLPITADHIDFSVTSSIGIVRAPENGSELDILLSKADIAMYEAKKHRNQAFLFSKELEQRSARNIAIEKELRFAIERNELSMVYQPQVSTGTNTIIGVEALVRWHSSALGIVPPNDFIPIAENIGLMNELGRFITIRAIEEIEHVCQQIGPLRLSINVSVQQLLTDGFFEFFQGEVERHSSEQLSLMLEVTESMFIEDLKLAIHVLERFSDMDIRVSLDDFGTGFSSLSLLANLPIHELKIDKDFVDQILTDDKVKRLVHSIITIGKDLQLTTIAEGVEEQDQLAVLEEFGCDFIQGYWFSKPLTKTDLIAFLHQSGEETYSGDSFELDH